MQKRRVRGVMLAVALLAGTAVMGSPAAKASEATGSLVFAGRMTFGTPMPGEAPDAPSVPSQPVGSGETFPVSGGNENCGKNNSDGGIWATHVPDPFVDEIGLCKGSGGLPTIPGAGGGWSMALGTEPPDVCRGHFQHGTDTGGQVCSLTSTLGSWGGWCGSHSGAGQLDVTYTGALSGPDTARLYIFWSAVDGVAAVTGYVYAVDGGTSHSTQFVTGTMTFTPDTPCGLGDSAGATVTGELVWTASSSV